jgi:hypothetical protein
MISKVEASRLDVVVGGMGLILPTDHHAPIDAALQKQQQEDKVFGRLNNINVCLYA